MNLRNLSAWSIQNPIVPIVLFVGLLLAGMLSFARMDVNNNPDIDFPGVNVTVVQPGAAPSEINTQITQKVEAAVRSINGVDQIQSTAREGASDTFIQFELGIDPNDATNEVRNTVDQIRSDLPDGILEPQVTKIDIAGEPIAYFAISADDMTMEQLSWFVDDTVSKRLLSIEGMAAVSRGGGVDREIRVVLDPAKMQSLGVTASQVNAVLRQVNVDAAGGQSEIADARQSVRVLGNARDAYDLGETRINLSGGRIIRLRDVATVTDSYSEQTRVAKLKGRQVVTFSLERAKGASEVSVYDDAMAEIEKIKEENPGISFFPLFTSTEYTKDQYKSSIEALVEGALLAIIVVFFFLRDWRATIISAIAIPLSAIPTFFFMDLMGFSLNTLSLLALSLVAGVLVDDAIVEIENIVRHMRMGKSAYQASIDAADEIGLAVVATTMSIVAVFLPVGLMPGISGQFFKNFGLTVVAAVLTSLAVARMITPMIAAYFLRSHGHAEHGEGRMMDLYMKVLPFMLDERKAEARKAQPARAIEIFAPALILAAFVFISMTVLGLAGADYGENASDALIATGSAVGMAAAGAAIAGAALFAISFVLRLLVGMFRRENGRDGVFASLRNFGHRVYARLYDHRFWAFCGGIGALLLTMVLFMTIPQQFQPTIDSDTSRVRIEMVPGTTLQQTVAVADQISELLYAQPEVERALQNVREGSANIYIALKEDRKTTSIDFERRLAPELQSISDARASFASQSGGFGSGRDITVMLAGSDPDLLQDTANKIVNEMRGLNTLVAPRIEADLQRPELIITPRPDLAAQLGVTTAALSQAIRIATIGEIDQNAAKFSLSDRQIPIRVVLSKSSRSDIAVIENLPVPTANGGSVPLSRVAEISFGAGPTQIQRFNQSRRIIIGADLAEGQVKGPVMEEINKLPTMANKPTGVSSPAVGEDEWQAEMIQNFIIAVITGILLVFAVLVLLYKRVVSPLVNMTSLLLAPLGGLLVIWFLGFFSEGLGSLSMPVYIGVLMLLGIVAKNSILLIDFAIEEMDKGIDKKVAIIDAGHKRAQPIVMTTVAMAAGMVPTALSLSGDGAWRQPMGLVVIGGLILSTILTLVIVPAGFSIADGFEKRIGPKLRNMFLTYRPGDEHGPRDEQTDRGGALPAE
ncbi:efflux RND transporter permease subunit [Croceicoccus naphthovorans]|uniref:Transporter n=1 Tax=Croceicoccus naphthovorans TaxID=1348774 RepID=A0A0G3XKQ9_9SPHN|nr:efflux RND transporter permease subunit [Croceicoccus naphthovorans]AKM11159.1 transporter [Croceicoccus naphthovorans]MBB3989956.1 multidrug efflux pump subunit AcrB [Croceicoccus naphthovorans]